MAEQTAPCAAHEVLGRLLPGCGEGTGRRWEWGEGLLPEGNCFLPLKFERGGQRQKNGESEG